MANKLSSRGSPSGLSADRATSVFWKWRETLHRARSSPALKTRTASFAALPKNGSAAIGEKRIHRSSSIPCLVPAVPASSLMTQLFAFCKKNARWAFIRSRHFRFLEVARNPASGAFVTRVEDANGEFRGTSKTPKCRDEGKAKPTVFEHHLFGSGYAGLGIEGEE